MHTAHPEYQLIASNRHMTEKLALAIPRKLIKGKWYNAQVQYRKLQF